jgi:hypothetical protein
MAGVTGWPNSQVKLVSGYVNSENNPALGVPLASPSGSIVQPYGGFLGLKIALSEDDAKNLTAPSTAVTRPSAINPPGTVAAATPLLGGVYMMVRLASGVTLGTGGVNAAVGRVVAWDLSVAADLYQVYFPATADNNSTPLLAGVLINPTVAQAVGNTGAALTAGNYCFIQIAGRCIFQLSSQTLATTKSPYLVWSRSSTAGDLGSVQYASNTTNATTFGSGNAGTAPNLTNTQIGDLLGVVESGNASAPALPTTASAYVIANVPYGRFAWRE